MYVSLWNPTTIRAERSARKAIRSVRLFIGDGSAGASLEISFDVYTDALLWVDSLRAAIEAAPEDFGFHRATEDQG